MVVLCCQPFTSQTYTYCFHKESIFYHLASQQSPNSCVLSILIIILGTALRLTLGSHLQTQPLQASSRLCLAVQTHTHTLTLTSLMLLIAADGSHCHSSVWRCYCISACDFILFSCASHVLSLPIPIYLPPFLIPSLCLL